MKKKRGRPELPIKPEQVEMLAQIGCTIQEMAAILYCSDNVLNNRFQPELDAGRANLKVSLRKAQIKLALGGNPTMLIWLGKQLLNQVDKLKDNEDTMTREQVEEEFKKLGFTLLKRQPANE